MILKRYRNGASLHKILTWSTLTGEGEETNHNPNPEEDTQAKIFFTSLVFTTQFDN